LNRGKPEKRNKCVIFSENAVFDSQNSAFVSEKRRLNSDFAPFLANLDG